MGKVLKRAGAPVFSTAELDPAFTSNDIIVADTVDGQAATRLSAPAANYSVADSFDRKCERDYSTGDVLHVFVADVPVAMVGGTRRTGSSVRL